ncbi:MAG: sulfide-dependent adenosine diphosphate thiazole synthase [Candidatus Altiarchaeota archaeon]|nr:sulfide-dependent adenosine diphosphate thiazole synthase [Candidatus Altiarchaeota archaeon]
MAIFQPTRESDITKAIVSEFTEEFLDNVESDVIIVGGGPSGLVAGMRLAQRNIKTVIVESNNYLGGGFWIGGYLMNKLMVRAPGQRVLDEINAPYKKLNDGLFVADGPHACSKLISSACDAGVKIINCTRFEDVILKENRVSGAVINWNAVSALPRAITCVDPVAIESKVVIDATGHDACVVKSLEDRGILKTEGFGPMWVERSEDAVVENTTEIYPGLIVTGMSVATAFGLPRMGPTFGGMLLSGEKAAEIASNLLGGKSEIEVEVKHAPQIPETL